MKNLSIAFIFVLIFSGISYGIFYIAPLKERVQKSDLIFVGTLHSVSEYNTEEFRHSSGILSVQKVIWGNLETSKGISLKFNDKLQIKWKNSNLYACQFNFPENKRGIWLLQVKNDGSIKPLYVGAMTSIDELSKVKNLLKNKKRGIKSNKIIKTVQEKPDIKSLVICKHLLKDSKEPFLAKYIPFTENSNSTQDALLRALLVIIIALILYRLLYRARFKIKVKKEKKEKDRKN